jgi:hypothetical protein
MSDAITPENDFTNPLSPERRAILWKMIEEDFTIHEMLEEMLHYQASNLHSAEKAKEMEALAYHLEQIVEKERVMWETTQTAQLNEQIEKIRNLAVGELKQEWIKLLAMRSELTDNIQSTANGLATNQWAVQQNAENWQKTLRETYSDKMLRKQISFVDVEGKTITPEAAQAMLEKVISAAPSPTRLVNVVAQSYEAEAVLQAVAQTLSNAPTPPPLPPKPTAKHMAVQSVLNVEFKLLVSAQGGSITGSELTKLLRAGNNRRNLAAVFEKSPDPALFEEAIQLREAKLSGEAELQQLKEKLTDCEKLISETNQCHMKLTNEALNSTSSAPRPIKF